MREYLRENGELVSKEHIGLSELTVWKSPEGLNTGLKSGLESNSKDGKCTVYKLMVA